MANNDIKPNREIEDFLTNELFTFWNSYLKYEHRDYNFENLKNEIRNNLKKGLKGVGNELDCVRDEFSIITKEHPYYENLENIWDHLNWYKDYFDKLRNKEETKELLGIKETEETINKSL